jgi:subtilisin family serine protease
MKGEPVRRCLSALAPLFVVALAAPMAAGAAENQQQQTEGKSTEYVVVYDQAAIDAARASIAASGAQIERENTEVGVATVRSNDANLVTDLASRPGVVGVAHNTTIGSVPRGGEHPRLERDAIEKAGRENGATARRFPFPHHNPHHNPQPDAEPLADLQWDMQQMHATPDGSYRFEQGDKRVLVGILDTGVDGHHPDIAPNFSEALSRNFTVDMPVDANGDVIDGPCAEEPDHACTDPADVDEDGHGTHVASTIASPINDLGIAGVAPNVTLVNIRAGQDSGYFFLQPTVDALTYAGDIGVDVVNMSYYVDPWLFNCVDNPADSPADQLEQRTIITAVQRALDYAHHKGVTLVSAAGNEAIDYTKTNSDDTSPDFASEPGEAPYARTIPPACISMPSEGAHVIPVSATGRSTRKAYYSSFGLGYVDVAAPGGDAYDTPDGSRDATGLVLAAYPESVGRAVGDIDDNGDPTNEFVVKDCENGTCAYYQYLQGTSMASPHAVGVAALIVSKYGYETPNGFGLSPFVTRARLRFSADPHPCPTPNPTVYTRLVPQDDGTVETVVSDPQTCEGWFFRNGFYGSGIVDAQAAVGF